MSASKRLSSKRKEKHTMHSFKWQLNKKLSFLSIEFPISELGEAEALLRSLNCDCVNNFDCVNNLERVTAKINSSSLHFVEFLAWGWHSTPKTSWTLTPNERWTVWRADMRTPSVAFASMSTLRASEDSWTFVDEGTRTVLGILSVIFSSFNRCLVTSA